MRCGIGATQPRRDGEPLAAGRRRQGCGASWGVSLGTVSNVLSRPDRGSEATRARGEGAMRVLGFVRNEAARQLRAGHSRVVAYVVLDGTNPFFTDVAQAVEVAASLADL